MARLTVSFGILAEVALSTASRNLGLESGSPPPSRAATVTSRISLLQILPRFLSLAAFLCLMVDHLLCPDIPSCFWCKNRKLGQV